SYRITASPEAQRWFDQGLRLVYGFNHAEAARAFREAARRDPSCAMCYWGLALTEGSNYNSPTDADRETRALPAVRQAQQLRGRGGPAGPPSARAAAPPPLRVRAGKAGGSRPRIPRREARGGPPVPGRPGGLHVLRRRADEPAAMEPVGARRQSPRRHRGAG